MFADIFTFTLQLFLAVRIIRASTVNQNASGQKGP